MTPERRAEIEAMADHLYYDDTEWGTNLCPSGSVIRELLAEIDQLTEQRDAFRQLWKRLKESR